uniref:Uncharacterized protein n=1 Tax=Anguilla anguilla TaxID=7936 RepID=A0A0E9RR11_ANGAN
MTPTLSDFRKKTEIITVNLVPEI